MTAAQNATQQKSQATKLAAIAAEERAREEREFWDRAFLAAYQGMMAYYGDVPGLMYEAENAADSILARRQEHLSARRNRGEGHD